MQKEKKDSRNVGGEGDSVAKNGAAKEQDIPQPSVVVKKSDALPSEDSSKPKPQASQKRDKKQPPASQADAEKPPVKAGTPGSPATPSAYPTSQDEQKPSRAHSSDKKDTLTGFFTSDEVQLLENFKLEFCNINGLSADNFDHMVQHSERDKTVDFPCYPSIISKQDFWKTIYETIPRRDRRSVYRFMRRHFQASTQKPHQWSHEQDEELVSLHARYGPKWALIAKLVGRSDDDVVQRWKNRLEHRGTMLRGPWSAEEIRSLQDSLHAAWKNMKKAGYDVGKDIYEMDETRVGWGQVSNRMQNTRSRQQCADKWRRIRKRVLDQRAKGDVDATYEPTLEFRSPKKPKSPAVTLVAQQKQSSKYMSSEYVNSDDEGDGDEGQTSVVPSPSKRPAGEAQDTTLKEKPAEATEKGASGREKEPSEPALMDEPVSESGTESESDSGSEAQQSKGKPEQEIADKSKVSNKKTPEPTAAKTTNGSTSKDISKDATKVKPNGEPKQPPKDNIKLKDQLQKMPQPSNIENQAKPPPKASPKSSPTTDRKSVV